MTKIILAVQISGTRDGKSWPQPGTEVDLPEEEAKAMVKSGSAYDPDDEATADKVTALKGGLLKKIEIAGAPEGRDWTEGQHDTNLSRARLLALEERDTREVAREAAKETEMDDEHTVPAAIQAANGPVVGDDEPNPTDAMAGRVGSTGAEVQTAAVEPDAETAADTRRPRGRRQ